MRHLIHQKSPWGIIKFVHHDGTTHSFYSVVNRLTGSRLSAFDSNPPEIDSSMSWVKSVFRDIHRKAKVLETSGRLAAAPRLTVKV